MPYPKGTCRGCGGPPESEQTRCEACAAAARAKEDERRERKRAKGECYRCSKTAVAGGYCAEHEQDQARAQKARYQARVVKGLCPACGRTPRADGTLCDACVKARKPGKSVPYAGRSKAGKDGSPRFRLAREWGEICAEVQDEGLVEQGTSLLTNLLRRHKR